MEQDRKPTLDELFTLGPDASPEDIANSRVEQDRIKEELDTAKEAFEGIVGDSELTREERLHLAEQLLEESVTNFIAAAELLLGRRVDAQEVTAPGFLNDLVTSGRSPKVIADTLASYAELESLPDADMSK